jgi:hypothetical protein
MKTTDQDIPELKREQLGVGVRGKYAKDFAERNHVVFDQQSTGRVVGNRKEQLECVVVGIVATQKKRRYQ